MTAAAPTRGATSGRPIPALTDDQAARVLSHAPESPLPGACHVWTGTRAGNGYGTAMIDGRRYMAHRLVWTLRVGPLSPGLTLDHVCRNRLCVNPAHLEEVTQSTNTRRRDEARGLRTPGSPTRAELRAEARAAGVGSEWNR